MMIKDISAAQQSMPNWETYQKGLEALAMALGSSKGSEEGAKKALTINDLLVKVLSFPGSPNPFMKSANPGYIAYTKNLQISSTLL